MAEHRRTVSLVLIPGMQCTARLWDEVGALLPAGHPRHVAEIGATSIDGAADDVLAASEGDLILMGHSLGGVVALAAARRAPERVLALALISVNPSAPTAGQREAWSAMARDALADDLESQIERTVTASTPAGTTAEVASAMAAAVGPDGLLAQLATQQSREDERPGLSRFAGPILMLGGLHDLLVPPRLLRAVAALNTRTTLALHETAQHLLPIEDPAWVARQLGPWVLSSPDGPGRVAEASDS